MRHDTQSVRSICTQTEQMISAVPSSRRGRSAKSVLVPGLSADFKDRKPTESKVNPPATPANIKKRKLKVLNRQLQPAGRVLHPRRLAPRDYGGPHGKFFKGYDYTVIYNEDKYHEDKYRPCTTSARR